MAVFTAIAAGIGAAAAIGGVAGISALIKQTKSGGKR